MRRAFYVIGISLKLPIISVLGNLSITGSGDALAYDSLKSVALLMGYKMAYLISALTHMVTFTVTCALTEVGTKKDTHISGRMVKAWVDHFAGSLSFLIRNKNKTYTYVPIAGTWVYIFSTNRTD